MVKFLRPETGLSDISVACFSPPAPGTFCTRSSLNIISHKAINKKEEQTLIK